LMLSVPKTAMSVVACVMNVPEEGPVADFFWREITPDDLAVCVEELDKLNNFTEIGRRLLDAGKYLAKRYGAELPGLKSS